MNQDRDYDEVEKLAIVLGQVGEAFAAMYAEFGKKMTDLAKIISDAFDEAADERAGRVTEEKFVDDTTTEQRTCSAVSTYLITPAHNGPRRHGGRYAGPLECILEFPHTGQQHYCGCCGVHWSEV
jgi:hypothetical protein